MLTASTVTVRSNVNLVVNAHSENIAGSLLASGVISQVTARIGATAPSSPATVATYVGETGQHRGDERRERRVGRDENAHAENQGVSASFFVGLSSADSNATVQPTIRTYADGRCGRR